MTNPPRRAGQDAEEGRIILMNIAMAMVAVALMVILAGCAQMNKESKAEATTEEIIREACGENDDGTITVTGSRLRRGEFDSASPIQIIDGEVSRDLGLVDADDILGQTTVVQGEQVTQSEAPQTEPSESETPQENREQYDGRDPNPVKVTAEEPVSTFSIDVDTASYSVMRSYLCGGSLPPRDAIRIEEFVNYFPYNYPLPEDKTRPFEPSITVTPTPWNADTKLMRIGIEGYDIEPDQVPGLNLVMLLDVSGSMGSANKLPLLKKAMGLLVDSLGKDDRVSIVVYAGASGVVLEPTPGNDKAKIMGALEQLQAGGSTAGGEGIRLAYALAERNFDKNKVNRVMLATDGDFNVGITDPEQLEDFVARKRETGIFLTVLGFGRGNYNDLLMQKLTQAGNGQAAYIDTLREAQKVLVHDVRATLFPIAKDVKIQVEFNPKAVVEYRLIGYETRLLNREDFNNDAVDAGEIGSGHTVTALYEIVPVGSPARLTDPLRYQDEEESEGVSDPQALEYAFVRMRYKLPDEEDSKLIEKPVLTGDALMDFSRADEDMRFAASVAAFGQKLRGDPYLKGMDYDDILEIADDAGGEDEFGYRAEFTQLVRLAKTTPTPEPEK